jgi:hypothetical protein
MVNKIICFFVSSMLMQVSISFGYSRFYCTCDTCFPCGIGIQTDSG